MWVCATGEGLPQQFLCAQEAAASPCGERASEGCAELRTTELREEATAVQRTWEGNGNVQKLPFPSVLSTLNWRKWRMEGRVQPTAEGGLQEDRLCKG